MAKVTSTFVAAKSVHQRLFSGVLSEALGKTS